MLYIQATEVFHMVAAETGNTSFLSKEELAACLPDVSYIHVLHTVSRSIMCRSRQ